VEKGLSVYKERLNAKQLRFCSEYLVDLNGAAAARRSGYSENSASEQAYQLLQLTHIQHKIKELNAQRIQRVQLDSDYVIRELLTIANDNLSNYVTLAATKTGKLRIKWKDLSTVDTKNISEFSYDKNGFKFKRYSRENALIQLGRHLGLFEDKISLKANLEKILSEHVEKGTLNEAGLTRLAELIIEHHKKINRS